MYMCFFFYLSHFSSVVIFALHTALAGIVHERLFGIYRYNNNCFFSNGMLSDVIIFVECIDAAVEGGMLDQIHIT